MKEFCTVFALVAISASAASAATIINKDDKDYTLVITEGGDKTDLSLAAGQTISVCPSGCFVTLPDGDRAALTGPETVEISGGRAKIK